MFSIDEPVDPGWLVAGGPVVVSDDLGKVSAVEDGWSSLAADNVEGKKNGAMVCR